MSTQFCDGLTIHFEVVLPRIVSYKNNCSFLYPIFLILVCRRETNYLYKVVIVQFCSVKNDVGFYPCLWRVSRLININFIAQQLGDGFS